MKYALTLPLICAAMFACAALGIDSAKLKADEINCSEAAIKAALPDALPLVTIALSGQNADATLAADAIELGADVVACAVAVAVRDLQPKVPVATAPPSNFKADTAADTRARLTSTTPVALAVTNGRVYLAAQTRKPMLK